MRSVLALLVVGLVAPAAANPRGREVSASRMASSRELLPAREAPRTANPPTMREPGRRSSLAKGLPARRAPVKREQRLHTEPTLWNSLRDKVYDRLPHGGSDRAFSYTLMPMVITGADDSAPGLGLSGSF